MNLTSIEKEIVFLARRTLNLCVRHQHSLLKYTPKNSFLNEYCEVILTLRKSGRIRGKVKSRAFAPLYEVIIFSVVAASFFDRRFPEVKVQELFDIEVELVIIKEGKVILKVSEEFI